MWRPCFAAGLEAQYIQERLSESRLVIRVACMLSALIVLLRGAEGVYARSWDLRALIDLAIVGPHRLVHAIELDGTVQMTPVLLALSWLLPMNILIFFFNIVPAYPLDGGRIARAVIWRITCSSTTDCGEPLSSTAALGTAPSRWPRR